MMRRHLLALFALFSGLATLHAPASASTLETLVFDARAFARANDTGAEQSCVCERESDRRPALCRDQNRPRLPGWLRKLVLPPIVFGSDRALE